MTRTTFRSLFAISLYVFGSAISITSHADIACQPPVTDYYNAGNFTYTQNTHGSVKVWVPDLAPGCKAPVISFSNGTSYSCSDYEEFIEHLASHGFITACYESGSMGDGQKGVDATESALNNYPNITEMKLGFAGHSQGGGGSINSVYFAEQQWGSSAIYAGAHMQAHPTYNAPSGWQNNYAAITSPVAIWDGGSSDFMASPSTVKEGYDALGNIEKALYTHRASHLPPPNDLGGEFAVAWFRWHLLGDTSACQYFQDMPIDSPNNWSDRESAMSACGTAPPPGPTPDPTPDPTPATCVTATLNAHTSADRASQFGFSNYIAAGSWDYLGLWFHGSRSVTLEETSTDFWEKSNCTP